MPQLVRSQLVALQQLLPGKCSRLPRQNVIQGLIRKRERPSELIEFDPASPDSIAHKTERLHHAAKAGSLASVATKGCACANPSAFFLTSAGEPNNSPLRSKKSPLSGCPHS